MGKHKYYKRHQDYQHRSGFTIVEVVLALALSGFLLAGVIGSSTANINRQRYNDSVQSFSAFLRKVYADVISVENPREESTTSTSTLCTVNSDNVIATGGTSTGYGSTRAAGRSDCLIYGKLIMVGEPIRQPDGSEKRDHNLVHVYDVIGDKKDDTSALNELHLDILTRKVIDNTCVYDVAGNSSTYSLEWGATIQNTDESQFNGTILIVRMPVTGIVATYRYTGGTLDGQTTIGTNVGLTPAECINVNKKVSREGLLSSQLDTIRTNDSHFVSDTIKFCVASNVAFAYDRPRMVSIAADGNNTSAVKVAKQDDPENECR